MDFPPKRSPDDIYMDNITTDLLSRRLDIIKLIQDSTQFDATIEEVFGSKALFTQKLLTGPTGLSGPYGNVGDLRCIGYNNTVERAARFWQDVNATLD